MKIGENLLKKANLKDRKRDKAVAVANPNVVAMKRVYMAHPECTNDLGRADQK